MRQLGIFKPHGVQAICSGDQVALSFSFMYSIVACDRILPAFLFSVALDRIIHQVQKTGVPFRDAGRKPDADQMSGMGSFQTFSSRQNCARNGMGHLLAGGIALPEKVSVVPSLSSSALTSPAANAAGTSASIRLRTSRMLRSRFFILILLFHSGFVTNAANYPYYTGFLVRKQLVFAERALPCPEAPCAVWFWFLFAAGTLSRCRARRCTYSRGWSRPRRVWRPRADSGGAPVIRRLLRRRSASGSARPTFRPAPSRRRPARPDTHPAPRVSTCARARRRS